MSGLKLGFEFPVRSGGDVEKNRTAAATRNLGWTAFGLSDP
jgi:hypothetical protein